MNTTENSSAEKLVSTNPALLADINLSGITGTDVGRAGFVTCPPCPGGHCPKDQPKECPTDTNFTKPSSNQSWSR